MDKHNFYGNVSFIVSWKNVLDNFGCRLYFIDQTFYSGRSYTRLLLTKKNYDRTFAKVDLDLHGSALLKQFDEYLHVTRCSCKQRSGSHKLQIGIEADRRDGEWLFANCSLFSNDHSKANSFIASRIPRNRVSAKRYESFACFLYNTMLKKECPNRYSITETEELLKAMGIRDFF